LTNLIIEEEAVVEADGHPARGGSAQAEVALVEEAVAFPEVVEVLAEGEAVEGGKTHA
jgi:hypothetical protein